MQTALKENIGYCRLQFSETNKEKIAKKLEKILIIYTYEKNYKMYD